MNLDIDSGKLLYGLGVLFVAAALLYFVRDVVFDLSVTVKAALLFASFLGFLLAGVTVRRDLLDTVALALSAVSYVVWLGYVVRRFETGEATTFLLLAASGALFVGLGYVLRERRPTVSRRTAGAVVVGLLALSVALIGADAVGGGVSYDLETDETVTVEPVSVDGHDRAFHTVERRVGTVTATNGFVFRRTLELPTLRGCLLGVATPNRDDGVHLDYDTPSYERPETLSGGASQSYDVRATFPVAANRTEPVTYRVERGVGCDGDRQRPTLVVGFDGR